MLHHLESSSEVHEFPNNTEIIDAIEEKFSELVSTYATTTDEKFEKLLQKVIEVTAAEFPNNTEVPEAIEEKFSELKRISFQRKLSKLLEEYQIDLKPLWHKTTENIPEALHEMITRRNHYIHKGQIDDYFLCLQDVRRIRYLLSIWLLKLLDFPMHLVSDHDHDLWYAQRIKKELDL